MATDFTAAQLSPLGAEWAVSQARANALIEGFEPDHCFERDLAQLAAGEISQEEFLQRTQDAIAREKAKRDGHSGIDGS